MRVDIELNIVKRNIELHGIQCRIVRKEMDRYNEPTGNVEMVYEDLKVLYHVVKGYSSKVVTDGTVSRSKGQPMMMITFDKSDVIVRGDIVTLNSKEFVVIDKTNVQELNIITDISLEEVI